MEYVIRQYQKTDYPELLSILNSVYQSTVEQHILEREYLNNGQYIFVAIDVEQNCLVGCAFAEIIKDYIRPKKTMYISYVAVKTEYRRFGIGKRLISEIINKSKSDGCSAIELTSANYRVGAHSFYQALGFTKKETTVFIKELDE